jgi:transposase
MPRKSQRPKLHLNPDQRQFLVKLRQSRKAPLREIHRATILLEYADGKSISKIRGETKLSRPTIYKCIDKALAAGIETGLKDKYHRPKEPSITAEAKAWVVNLACSKPKEHGYAAEMWTLSQLAKHTRQYAPSEGHDLLVVYQEVNAQNDNPSRDDTKKIVTLSVDEKPGIQAIKNIAPDLPPKPGKHPRMSRDYEYKRLGTVSLLAGLDLHDGHVIAQVHDRHRSREFIMLLKEIDAFYPENYQIRLILDNHSAHISKETMAFLATRPNRFTYVHTPTHGSWLNLVETLFSKISRTFLKRIRVQSKQELKDRILKGITEINAEPVIHRWRKFDFAQI